MEKNLIKKGLVFAVILFFIGMSIIPVIESLSVEKNILTKELYYKFDNRNENDTTPPVTTIYFNPPEPNGLNDWYVTNIVITLEATDDLSGVDYIKYLLDDNDWTIYTSPLIIESDGYHRITYYAVDKAGNVEQPNEVVRFKLDKTKPVINLTYKVTGGNFLEGWELTFTAIATDNMSGMERVEFTLNNVLQKTVTGPGPIYQWIILWTIIPFHIIKAIAYDIAGKDAYDYIEDPTPHKNQQTIPTQLTTTIKNKSKKFFPVGIFFRSVNSSFNQTYYI